MRLFVPCAVILFGTLVCAQGHNQPAENENKSNHTTNNPQPATTIPEVHACSTVVEQTAQSKQQTANAESRPFLTHGEWVMAILTAIYVGISYFGLRAIKRQADIAQSNTEAIIDAERAWIDIDLIRIGKLYRFVVTNYGKTHGIIIEYDLIYDEITKEDYKDLPRRIEAKEKWGSREPVEMYNMVIPNKPFPLRTIDLSLYFNKPPSDKISIFGALVEYDSIGGPYTTEVVYLVQPDPLNHCWELVNVPGLTRYSKISPRHT